MTFLLAFLAFVVVGLLVKFKIEINYGADKPIFHLNLSRTWGKPIKDFNNKVIMNRYTIINVLGCHLDVHEFQQPDMVDCLHTHPSYALRFPIWGGYWEEIATEYVRDTGEVKVREYIERKPFRLSIVPPAMAHRLANFRNGKTSSWSLWFRLPVMEEIYLIGEGWPDNMRGKVTTIIKASK